MNGRASVEQPGALPFDSTQTVRAITPRELRDPNGQKWFAVQLAVSDRPVNLETMPRLDAFANYRLYAIQGRLGTRPCHALRLGFFSDHAAALTLCQDMHALFRFASVVQVSAAEQARFEKVPKQEAQVVEISSARRSVADSPIVAATPAKPAAQPAKPPRPTQGRKKFKSLSQELLEEARQIELARLARTGGKPGAAQSTSWLSRLLGRSSR